MYLLNKEIFFHASKHDTMVWPQCDVMTLIYIVLNATSSFQHKKGSLLKGEEF